MIESSHPQLSIRRQCELLGLNRSSFYYEPATETIENLRLMRRIDEQYLKTEWHEDFPYATAIRALRA